MHASREHDISAVKDHCFSARTFDRFCNRNVFRDIDRARVDCRFVDNAVACRFGVEQLLTRLRIMIAPREISPVIDKSGQKVLDVVIARAEFMMAHEKRFIDRLGAGKIHCRLGVEKAVEHVRRARLQCRIKIVERNAREQIGHLRHFLHALEHGIRRHHQLHQRRILRVSMINERQEVKEIVDAELEILSTRLIFRQLVDGVRKPVIVILPMIGCNETLECELRRLEQIRIVRDRIQPHHSEDRLAVVVHDAERLFYREIFRVEHVHE